MGTFATLEVREIYRRIAPNYDRSLLLLRLCGFREQHYRRRAVAALALRPGATVVDLGCGTGRNFPLLRAAVGPQGRVVGVDLTDAMLRAAPATSVLPRASAGWVISPGHPAKSPNTSLTTTPDHWATPRGDGT